MQDFGIVHLKILFRVTSFLNRSTLRTVRFTEIGSSSVQLLADATEQAVVAGEGDYCGHKCPHG